jgi:hypothetical protein
MNAPLRGCPTCGTPVAEAKLGLRDYRWVTDHLPGRVAPMDVDFLLERRGNFLIIEFKPRGVKPPPGQARSLRTLRNAGADVWLVYGDGPVSVDFGDGELFEMSTGALATEVRAWYEDASQEVVPDEG